MAKIQFDDKSHIEISKSSEPGKIIIVIQAADISNPLKKIANSVEISKEQWQQLISDISK